MSIKALIIEILLVNPWNIPVDDVNIESVYCMSHNIYHESRGESLDGQIAVASVTMNRVNHPKYPDSICGVVKDTLHYRSTNPSLPVLHQCSFSWFCDGKSDKIYFYKNGERLDGNLRSFVNSVIVGVGVMHGEISDNTSGATHYYNPSKADPEWKVYYTKTTDIDNHTFLKRPFDSPY